VAGWAPTARRRPAARPDPLADDVCIPAPREDEPERLPDHATEDELRTAAELAYKLARREVFDLEQPGVKRRRTPRQLTVLAALRDAEMALRAFRAGFYDSPPDP
jgi:hypothetical protein